MNSSETGGSPRQWAANLLELDYRAEADRLGPPPVPIIDVHTHINGRRAAEIYLEACDAYGIDRTYTQTQLSEAEAIREVLGDRASFIAVPEYMSPDRGHAFREGFLENMRIWHGEFGARMVKFWHAPRICDFAAGDENADIRAYDGPWRMKQFELARELGMMIMTHVADPDTWFAGKYADAARYGTKQQQYEPFEKMVALDRDVPWLAAHMAGWPEDLAFMTDLLERHPNLHLDTSATKWMLRELSKHDTADLHAFLERFRGRILFGSDIVTMDQHLEASEAGEQRFGIHQASSREEAFDLYASRYWALRTMWESAYDGPSPIADPDLAMLEPEKFGELSSPPMRGVALSEEQQIALYHTSCVDVVERWYLAHGSR